MRRLKAKLDKEHVLQDFCFKTNHLYAELKKEKHEYLRNSLIRNM